MHLVSPDSARVFTLRPVEFEARPEPSEAERRAIAAALEMLGRDQAPPDRSPWRVAALAPDEEDYAVAPPRSSRGATRA